VNRVCCRAIRRVRPHEWVAMPVVLISAIAALDTAGLTISVIAIAIVAAIALREFGRRR
jgi:hypothetical protein